VDRELQRHGFTRRLRTIDQIFEFNQTLFVTFTAAQQLLIGPSWPDIRDSWENGNEGDEPPDLLPDVFRSSQLLRSLVEETADRLERARVREGGAIRFYIIGDYSAIAPPNTPLEWANLPLADNNYDLLQEMRGAGLQRYNRVRATPPLFSRQSILHELTTGDASYANFLRALIDKARGAYETNAVFLHGTEIH